MPSANSVNKFIRDPIHDIIRIEDQFILELLDTAAMQRLRRIRQLGLAWMVYPGAEHSRFTHSLGVYHLAGRAMDQLNRVNGSDLFDGGKREAVLAAALLHDVGHGPFSHIFENVAKRMPGSNEAQHENWTLKIVRDDKAINKILTCVSPEMPDHVHQILGKTYKPHYVTALISSQLDVDRFDYLLRDSHMTGVQYGAFDLEWMLRTLAVKSIPLTSTSGAEDHAELETVIIDGRRGLSSLESHLVGRHYMYKHVYYHKTIRAAEQMLHKIIERAACVRCNGGDIRSNEAFDKMARGEELSVDEYLSLDDFVLFGWIEEWSKYDMDKILRDLSRRLVRRDLLKPIVVPSTASHSVYMKNHDQLRKMITDADYDPDYYMLEDTVGDIAYKGYMLNLEQGRVADEEEIWFVDPDGNPCRLSAEYSILTQAENALKFQEDRWFVPVEVADTARKELQWT